MVACEHPRASPFAQSRLPWFAKFRSEFRGKPTGEPIAFRRDDDAETLLLVEPLPPGFFFGW